jgi:hypothetical protein
MLGAAALAARGAFVDQGGVRMVVVDASGLREPEDINAMITRFEELIRLEPSGSARVVTLVAGLHFDRRSAAAIKGVLVRVRPWIRASCLVGVTGLHRVLLQVLNQVARRERPLFDTLDQARDWPATQS